MIYFFTLQLINLPIIIFYDSINIYPANEIS